MERLIAGVSVKGSKRYEGRCGYCDFSMAVRRGHEECGDSAFAYCDEKKLIAAVFDGVSGEPGASSASSEAAIAMLAFLKKQEKIDAKVMEGAFAHAQGNVTTGFTTAAVLFMLKDGSFTIASVGDSPVYGIDKAGAISLELPLARPVGDGDSILKFFTLRNMVTSVLGPSGNEIHMRIASGRISKGEVLVLATDGLTDNLYAEVDDGYVTDCAGKKDLKALIGKERKPAAIAKKLMLEVAKRLKGGRKERKGGVLIPKEDDIAIIAVRRL